jgi:hypothetical protein
VYNGKAARLTVSELINGEWLVVDNATTSVRGGSKTYEYMNYTPGTYTYRLGLETYEGSGEYLYTEPINVTVSSVSIKPGQTQITACVRDTINFTFTATDPDNIYAQETASFVLSELKYNGWVSVCTFPSTIVGASQTFSWANKTPGEYIYQLGVEAYPGSGVYAYTGNIYVSLYDVDVKIQAGETALSFKRSKAPSFSYTVTDFENVYDKNGANFVLCQNVGETWSVVSTFKSSVSSGKKTYTYKTLDPGVYYFRIGIESYPGLGEYVYTNSVQVTITEDRLQLTQDMFTYDFSTDKTYNGKSRPVSVKLAETSLAESFKRFKIYYQGTIYSPYPKSTVAPYDYGVYQVLIEAEGDEKVQPQTLSLGRYRIAPAPLKKYKVVNTGKKRKSTGQYWHKLITWKKQNKFSGYVVSYYYSKAKKKLSSKPVNVELGKKSLVKLAVEYPVKYRNTKDVALKILSISPVKVIYYRENGRTKKYQLYYKKSF